MRGFLTRGRSSRAAVILALSTLALLVAVGCGGDDDDEPAEAGAAKSVEKFTVSLPAPDSILWTGYEVSRGSDGLYETEYGLDIETQAAEGDSVITQQLIAGRLDFGIPGVPLTIIANARGHEMYGIATIAADLFTIAATPDSGVASLEDLRGKKLGVTDIAGGEIPLVEAALKDAGLDPESDVELLPVGAGQAVTAALKDGTIAAYAASIIDFVPLESAGLKFDTILPEKFQGLPTTILVVRPEVLEDDEQRRKVFDMMKGWFEGTLYAEMYPEAGLERVCVLVPGDCQDPAFAEGFYKAAVDLQIDLARNCGRPDYEKLETVRDAIAASDVPEAAKVDVRKVFPDTYSDEMCPDEEVIKRFAERTGVSGG